MGSIIEWHQISPPELPLSQIYPAGGQNKHIITLSNAANPDLWIVKARNKSHHREICPTMVMQDN